MATDTDESRWSPAEGRELQARVAIAVALRSSASMRATTSARHWVRPRLSASTMPIGETVVTRTLGSRAAMPLAMLPVSSRDPSSMRMHSQSVRCWR